MKKQIYYVAGIREEIDTDIYYPVMEMLSGFGSSEYAHNIKMYTNGNYYRMVVDPVYDEAFKANPDNRKIHVFMVEGSEVFIEHIKRYLFEGKAWDRWDVKPYLELRKGKDGKAEPVEWLDEEFKKLFFE